MERKKFTLKTMETVYYLLNLLDKISMIFKKKNLFKKIQFESSIIFMKVERNCLKKLHNITKMKTLLILWMLIVSKMTKNKNK